MLDYEWFVSILDKDDLVAICKHFRIQPDGFTKRIENAPIHRLANELKSYLFAGLKKRKKKSIKYEELLLWVAEETQKQRPYLNEFSFESFIIQMETDSSIKTHQVVALLHEKYHKKYTNYIQRMMENTNKGEYVLKGLSKLIDLPPLEKIKTVIESSNDEKRIKERLEYYEKECLEHYPEVYPKAKMWIRGEEGRLLEMLVRTDKKERPYVMLAFLLTDNHFKKLEYQWLISQVESAFEHIRFIREKEKQELLMKDFTATAEEKKRLLIENKELLQFKESYSLLKNENELLVDEISILTRKLKKAQRILPFFDQLLEKKQFLIVTSDVELFEGTPFEKYVINSKKFIEDRKKKNIEYYLEKTLFFTRSSFQSREWGRLKNFLDNSSLKYVEIGNFDFLSYLEDIMKNFYQEENEYGYYI